MFGRSGSESEKANGRRKEDWESKGEGGKGEAIDGKDDVPTATGRGNALAAEVTDSYLVCDYD